MGKAVQRVIGLFLEIGKGRLAELLGTEIAEFLGRDQGLRKPQLAQLGEIVVK